MITLDTSGILAAIRRQDDYDEAAVAVLREDPGPFIIPASILAEIFWMLETMTPPAAVQTFLDDKRTGAYMVDWAPPSIERI